MENAFRHGDLQKSLTEVSALGSQAWAPPEAVKRSDGKPGAATEDPNESTGSKILRETQVFGTGLVTGIADGAKQSWDDKSGTALRLGAAVGTGALMTVMHGRTGAIGLAGRALSLGFGVSFVADVLAPNRINAVSEVWQDSWKSSANTDRNIAVTRQELGRFAFDTVVMTAGGVAGAKGAGRMTEMFPGALTKFGSSVSETVRGGMTNLSDMSGLRLQPAYATAEVGISGISGIKPAFSTPRPINENTMSSMRHENTWGGRHNQTGSRGNVRESGALNESPSDSQSLVSLFRESMAKAAKTEHLFHPPEGMPSFSAGTRDILTGGTRPLHERVYGKQYSAAEGFKDIVPYENVGRIIDPASFQPKSVGSLTEMGEMIRAKQRVELGATDAVAQGLKTELVASGGKVKALDEEGKQFAAALNAQIEVHGSYQAGDLRYYVREHADKAAILAGIEARAKEINILRLESARITMKMNKLDATDTQNAPNPALKKHMQEQKDFLAEEIAERSRHVGSVREYDSPISRAKEDVRRAHTDVRDWFVFNDRTYVEPVSFLERGHAHRGQHYDTLAKNIIEAQRNVDTNALAHKAMTVQFSETAYAYEARLHALQQPVIKAATTDAPRENMGVRRSSVTAPIDAKAAATSFLNGELQGRLRDHALSNLSTSVLSRPGALDQAVAKIYDQSTVVFFAGGKPLGVAGETGGKPKLALIDVKNFQGRLPQIGDAKPDGFAVLSPYVQADGSLAVLRTEPLASGQGTRNVYKKEVSAVGGSVPSNVTEGTSMGRIFGLFNGPR